MHACIQTHAIQNTTNTLQERQTYHTTPKAPYPMGLSGSISAALGTSLAGLLRGWGTAAPPPMLPTREAGCRGVPTGQAATLVSGLAARPVEGLLVPVTQKYLWPISDAGNTVLHSAGLPAVWKAIPRGKKGLGPTGGVAECLALKNHRTSPQSSQHRSKQGCVLQSDSEPDRR